MWKDEVPSYYTWELKILNNFPSDFTLLRPKGYPSLKALVKFLILQ